MATPNFTVEGRLSTIDDLQRNFMFEVTIPNIAQMVGVASGITPAGLMEGMTIRTKTCSIPGRGNDEIESFFMGMKQFFPGRPTFSNKLALQIDETEDQYVLTALTAWRNRIFDIRQTSDHSGYSHAANKRQLSTTIVLRQYKYDGTKLPNDIEFINAWPQEVGDVELAMAGNEKVTFNASFTYDFWRLVGRNL
jgi:hypothetical protein